MGSWGTGNFQNDAALDWMGGEFRQDQYYNTIEPTLREGLLLKEEPDWQEAMAAAELVAIIIGHPSQQTSPPEHLCIWVSNQDEFPNAPDIPPLVTLAVELVEHIIALCQEPGNRSQWFEESEFATFLEHQQDLLNRLQAPPRKIPKLTEEQKRADRPALRIGFKTFTKGGWRFKGKRYSIDDLPEQVPPLEPDSSPIKKPPTAAIPAPPKMSAEDEAFLNELIGDPAPTPKKVEVDREEKGSIEISLDQHFLGNDITVLADWLVPHLKNRIAVHRIYDDIYVSDDEVQSLLDRIAPEVEYLDLLLSGGLDSLSKASKLRILSIKGFQSPSTNLDFLSGLKSVEVLQLSTGRQAETAPFRDMVNLKSLVLGIEQANRFPELPQSLEELNIGIHNATEPTDIASITHLPLLRRLVISTDFAPLQSPAKLDNLLHFSASSRSPHFEFLKGAPQLQSVHISNSTLTDLSFLKELPNLERLELFQVNALEDLSILGALPKLKYLSLMHMAKATNLPILPLLLGFSLCKVPGVTKQDYQKMPALEKLQVLSSQGGLSAGELTELQRLNPKLRRATSETWPKYGESRFTGLM